MKMLNFLIIPLLIVMLLGFGMNASAELHSKWVDGDLIFYDGTTDIFAIRNGTDGVKIYKGITIEGTYDHGIIFSEDMVGGDVDNSFINVGQYNTAIAVAPTTANMFGVMHNVSLTDINVAYWYQAYYTKITTSGTTTNTSVAGHALRMQIATSLEAVYGIQCHTNISAGADVAQEIISVSTMVNLGTGETTSDRVVALQAMITGSGTAGTVVGDAIVGYFVNAGTVVTTDDIIKVFNQSAATVVDGIEIENDGTMTTALKINDDGTCGTAILLEGSFDHGIRFSADPVAGNDQNSFINIGDYDNAIAVAPTTDNMFGVIQNLTLNVNVAYWYQAYYTKITTSGTTTSTSIAGHAIRMNVASSLAAVYGIQCHTNITAGADATSEIVSISTMVDMGTGDTTTDRVVALQALISGSGTAGTVTGLLHVAYFGNRGTVIDTDAIVFINNQSAAVSDVAVEFDLDGTVSNVWEFNGSVCDAFGHSDETTEFGAFDQCILIPVKVEGEAAQLYIMAAETWASVD